MDDGIRITVDGERFFRAKQIYEGRWNVSKTTFYRLVRSGVLTKHQLSDGCVGYAESEVLAHERKVKRAAERVKRVG